MVVQLLWISGRALAAQARVSWVRLLAAAGLFTFLYFHLIVYHVVWIFIMKAFMHTEDGGEIHHCGKSLRKHLAKNFTAYVLDCSQRQFNQSKSLMNLLSR